MSAVPSTPAESFPRGWRSARLDALCEIQLGKMLSPAAKTGFSPLPYLRNQNVQWGRIDTSDVARMDFSDEEQDKFRLRKGDLLVCEGGEPGRAAVWDGSIEPCFYQKALHRLRPKGDAVDPHFLMFRLRLGALRGEFFDDQAKTTIAHLPAVRLASLRVAVPPLDEQKRIAAMLNGQMASAQYAAHVAEAQFELVARLPRAFLFKRFKSSDIAGAQKKRVRTLCRVMSGGTPAKDREDYWGGLIPWITVKDMKTRSVETTNLTITEKAVAETASHLAPAGTVLVLVRGMGLANGLPICEIRRPSAFNQDIKGFISLGEVTPAYLAWGLRVQASELLGDRQTVTHGTLKLDTETLLDVEIPVPPLDVQERVSRQLSDDFVLVDQVAGQLGEIESEVAELPTTLLRQAFSGCI